MTIIRTLTVTYDAALDSYVYNFRDRAVVNYHETLASGGSASFEYCDPWFTAYPAPP